MQTIMKSATEESHPHFAEILLVQWWPMRLQSSEQAIRLRDLIHGARMLASAFSEEESELTALWEIVVDYTIENLKHENA